MEAGKEIEFIAYDFRIIGKFIQLSEIDDNIIVIETISDNSGVYKKGEIQSIHRSYLINK